MQQNVSHLGKAGICFICPQSLTLLLALLSEAGQPPVVKVMSMASQGGSMIHHGTRDPAAGSGHSLRFQALLFIHP